MTAADLCTSSRTPDQIAAAEIVARSIFFYEHRQAFHTIERPAVSAYCLSALTWSEIAGSLKKEHFEKRFSWEPDLGRIVGAGEKDAADLNAVCKQAPWADFLVLLLHELGRTEEAGNVDQQVQQFAAIPFSQVLRPVVDLIVQGLPSAPLHQLFSEQTRLDLCTAIYKGCSELSLDLLMMEFSLFKACSELDAAQLGSDPYLHFVHHLDCGGFKSLLQEHPVYARVLCTHACQVVEAYNVFFLYLTQDRELLQAHFRASDPLFPVIAFSGDLSDSHHDGCRVHRLTMHGGMELIYKPRRIITERLLAETLVTINKDAGEEFFAAVDGVYLEDHGWVRAVDHKACTSISEVERFYRRSGALMCLLYLLEANDCHSENLIAHGEFPVLIDAETLLQCRVPPSFLGQANNSVAASGASLFSDSVFRVGMLPRWSGRAGALTNFGGLAAPAEQPVKRRRVVHANTAFMAWSVVSEPFTPKASHVLLGTTVQDPAAYVESIVDGFAAMYRFAEMHPDLFTAEDGPVVTMAKEQTRFLFRNTGTYDGLLRRCRNVINLADATSFSLPLEVLLLPVIASPILPPALEVIKVERRHLLRGDIPYISACPYTGTLWADGAAIACEPLLPALPLVVQRVGSLGQADLQLQTAYIRASFQSLTAGVPEQPHSFAEAGDAVVRVGPDFNLIEAAIQIAEDLTRHAVTVGDSSNWITRAYNPDAQSWQLQPMQPNLYDGVLGPALFYAALAAVTGDRAYASQARRSLSTVRASLAQPRGWLDNMPVGAGIGLGSIVYTCAVIAELLNDEMALEAACLAAGLLRPERMAADRVGDTISGSAGALLGLLRLNKVFPDADLFGKACGVAELLLQRQTRDGQQAGSWPTLEGKALCGISHGASGIAMVLRRFAETQPGGPYAACFEGAIDYEDRCFNAAEANWPTLLETNSSRLFLRRSWCHGAPGILLARMTKPDYVPRSTDRSALERTRQATATGLDHLCCGDLGVSEVLFAIAETMRDRSLAARAKKITQGVLHQRQRRGTFRLGVPDGLFTPGFHQGVTGIGYHLLRLSETASLPCVLNWS